MISQSDTENPKVQEVIKQYIGEADIAEVFNEAANMKTEDEQPFFHPGTVSFSKLAEWALNKSMIAEVLKEYEKLVELAKQNELGE